MNLIEQHESGPGLVDRDALAIDYLGRLQAAMGALAEAVAPGDVARVVVEQGLLAMGASGAGVAVIRADDPTMMDVLASSGYASAVDALFVNGFPITTEAIGAEAARVGEAIWVDSHEAYARRYPSTARVRAQNGYEASLAVPFSFGGSVRGVVTMAFPERRIFSEVDKSFAMTLAGLCGHALERSLLFDRERKARAAAEEASRRITDTFESITDAFASFDRSWRFTFVNSHAERVLKRSREELLGRSVFEVFPTASETSFIEGGERAMRERRSVEIEELGRVSRRWISARFFPTHEGIAVYFRDVTDRKEADAALRRNQELLSSILTGAPILVFAFDEHRVLSYAEGAGYRGIGVGPGDVVGRPATELFGKRTDILDDIERAFLGTVFTTRTKMKGRIFETWYSPMRGKGGRVTGIIGVSTDVTDRIEAQMALEQSQDLLRQSQRMEAIGRLAGGIAHDFNNLLTVINGYGEVIASRLSSNDPLRRDAEEIVSAGQRAATLTRQLLAFSRKQVLKPAVLDLNTLVENLGRMLERLLGEHIELDLRLEAPDSRIYADPGQIEQVIVNLAVNARDAMPEGGALTIETRLREIGPEGGDRLIGARPGRFVVLTVTDTGCGMDEATRRHAFEPFFTTKEAGRGTGLGLSTVYGIVTQSGGAISLETAPGSGSRFEIYLPFAKASVARPPSPQERVDVRGSETILLVEDEPSLRGLVRTTLAAQGYRVLEAGNGIEALDVVSSHDGAIDLVLTDVVMPKLGGRHLAEQLQHERPGIRVLFMSGYTDDATVRRREALLEKPFTPDQLTEAVRRALDRRPSAKRQGAPHGLR